MSSFSCLPALMGCVLRLESPLLTYSRLIIRSLADAQSALVTIEREDYEHHHRLSVEERRCFTLEALLCGVCSRLVGHVSLVEPIRGFLCQDMDSDVEDYFPAISAKVHEFTAGFRSETSNVVKTHSATLRQDVSSILTHLDTRLAATISDPSVRTSSVPFVPGAARPPSEGVL